MLVCTVPEHRDVPAPRGFAVVDGEWRCDLGVYREFLETVAGAPGTVDCGESDCYVVGNRLEGFIEQRWTDDLPDRYPDVETLVEIEALALFFRVCEADHRRGMDPAASV